MMEIKKVVLASTILAATILGGSVTGVAIASSMLPPPVQSEAGAVASVESFAVNDSGLTYGFVNQGLVSDTAARADLVMVTTDEGADGWAYSSELMPWIHAKTPQEAEALTTDRPYRVAVYQLDGKTLIGYQTVNRHQGQ